MKFRRQKFASVALILIFGFLFVIGLWLGFRYIFYGSMTASCPYTEQVFQPSPTLARGKIVSMKNLMYGEGVDPEHSCLVELLKVDKDIWGATNETEVAQNLGDDLPQERRGLKRRILLKQDAEFQVEKVIAVYKHGLSAVGGSGPIYHLILRNSAGDKFKFATVFAGVNEDELYLKLVLPEETRILDSLAFRELL